MTIIEYIKEKLFNGKTLSFLSSLGISLLTCFLLDIDDKKIPNRDFKLIAIFYPNICFHIYKWIYSAVDIFLISLSVFLSGGNFNAYYFIFLGSFFGLTISSLLNDDFLKIKTPCDEILYHY